MHSCTEYNEQDVERHFSVPIKYIYRSNLRQDDVAYLILTSNIFALKDCRDDGRLHFKYDILQRTFDHQISEEYFICSCGKDNWLHIEEIMTLSIYNR